MPVGTKATVKSLHPDEVRAVVERDEHPVRRRLRVGLQVLVAEPDRVLERAPGILRRVGRAAPVGEGQRARMIEESRRHGCEYALPP